MRYAARLLLLLLGATIVTACAATASAGHTGPGVSAATTAAPAATASSAPAPPEHSRPELDDWEVGARPLPEGPNGYGEVRPTPNELVVRRLPSPDVLPPPRSGEYESTISPVPPDVLARSTWRPECPVRPEELRYLTMSFLGFDGQPHTGEMIVHADVAAEVVDVFGKLFAARFPIEEMRVVAASELDAPPTGDGNNTTSFVCRPAVGLTRWSAHAYGLAIDINPFHNPYKRGDLVLPELASAYLDRDWRRPGMVFEGGMVVQAFDAIGWTWGGRWSSPIDYMHFSATGT